ncbi:MULTISPECIES: shikimate dehydrogenase family protein [Micrococcus]|uniref:shikimate dehydrogenase family protein n=1 Tax=Micrococcus antarcticus TaxID=86171 RepID=UPI00384DE255
MSAAPAPPGVRLRAGVLGRPIAHSLSPTLHGAAYAALGLPVVYDRHDLGPDGLPAFVRDRLGRASGATGSGVADPGEDWLGVSVTMPLKTAVVSEADVLTDRVRLLGVANTLVRDHPDHPGALLAHNTDVDGVVGALRTAGLDPAARGGAMGVLGNGGTAAAAVLAAWQLGADAVAFGVREPSRAADVADLAAGLGLRVEVMAQAELLALAPDLRALVATLPPRAADPLAPCLPEGGALPPLLDAAYDPWPSALAHAWSGHGGAVVSGVAMLLHQGVEQVRLFTGRPRREAGAPEPDWAAVTAAAARALGVAGA